jgi:uncharacterized membrane protein
MINGPSVARVIHVLGVVVWIGGVATITTIVLPLAARDGSPKEGRHLFESIERRFSWIARTMALLVGASGLYMTWALDLWSRFRDPAFWWMHAMVALWAVFTAILFVAEPLLHRHIAARMEIHPHSTFRRMQRLHWLLLIASLLVIAGAVSGAHGYSWFG